MENKELILEFGEVKTSPTQKITVFFTQVLPTGAEQPLSFCKELKKSWFHVEETENRRVTKTKYNILITPITLKMVTIIYGISNRLYPQPPKRFLYFTIDKTGDLIEVIGYKGVGKIQFNGYIDYERSSPEIKDEFEIKIIKPSQHNKKKQRNILY